MEDRSLAALRTSSRAAEMDLSAEQPWNAGSSPAREAQMFLEAGT
jgi:hypothetical protein